MNVSRAERCLHHPAREAVARCPECGRYFCRECVSEHEDRVLCARCLARGVRHEERRRSRFAQLARGFAAALGLCIAWWFFDLIGRGLMQLPVSVHEGSVWEKTTSSE